MKEIFIPHTKLGRWSVGFIAAFGLFMMLFAIMAVTGVRIGDGSDTFFGNLALAVPLLLAAFCGAAAFIAGLVAIIARKDLTVLVVLATVVGGNVLLFALGEALFPH